MSHNPSTLWILAAGGLLLMSLVQLAGIVSVLVNSAMVVSLIEAPGNSYDAGYILGQLCALVWMGLWAFAMPLSAGGALGLLLGKPWGVRAARLAYAAQAISVCGIPVTVLGLIAIARGRPAVEPGTP